MSKDLFKFATEQTASSETRVIAPGVHAKKAVITFLALYALTGSAVSAEKEIPCDEMVHHAVKALKNLGVNDPSVERMLEACIDVRKSAPVPSSPDEVISI